MKKIIKKKAETHTQYLIEDLKSNYAIGLKDLSSSGNVNHTAFINYLGFIEGTLTRNKTNGITQEQESIVHEFFKVENDDEFNSLMIEYLKRFTRGQVSSGLLPETIKDHLSPVFRAIGEKLFVIEAYSTLLSKYDFKV